MFFFDLDDGRVIDGGQGGNSAPLDEPQLRAQLRDGARAVACISTRCVSQ